MIRLDDITLAYGPRVLLSHVNARFGTGELVALAGRNGAGKSTLLRSVIGVECPASGRVMLDGKDAARLTPERLARTVAFVGTERVRIANLRCEDVVALGRAPYTNWVGRLQEEDRAIVADALRSVGMEAFTGRDMRTLSDGEAQRIMLARALAQQTPAIVLDEPSAFLDIPTRFEVCRLLGRLAHEQHKCILFSTHDLDAALPVCDSLAIIDNGKLLRPTATEAVEEGILKRIFGI